MPKALTLHGSSLITWEHSSRVLSPPQQGRQTPGTPFGAKLLGFDVGKPIAASLSITCICYRPSLQEKEEEAPTVPSCTDTAPTHAGHVWWQSPAPLHARAVL